MSKKGRLVVGKRVKRAKLKKGRGGGGRAAAAAGSGGAASAEASMRETKESMWEVVSGEISNLLQADDSRWAMLSIYHSGSRGYQVPDECAVQQPSLHKVNDKLSRGAQFTNLLENGKSWP